MGAKYTFERLAFACVFGAKADTDIHLQGNRRLESALCPK